MAIKPGDNTSNNNDNFEARFNEQLIEKQKVMRRRHKFNTTRLYFLLAVLASTATFATLFFWPAAFAGATSIFTTVAALTVFGVAPLAFFAGLGVLATALAATAIVFTAAVALYLGAKLTVAALKLTGQIVGSLYYKIQNMMNPPEPIVISNYNELKAMADIWRSGINTSSFNPTQTDMVASNSLEKNDDKDTVITTTISAKQLMDLFQKTLNENVKVARRSNPNETKTLNANKVKLMTDQGAEVEDNTQIAYTRSTKNFRAITKFETKELLSLVAGSGYDFFRTFNPNADGSASSKQPIPVKLV